MTQLPDLFRRGFAKRRRHGHDAAFPEIYHRLGLDILITERRSRMTFAYLYAYSSASIIITKGCCCPRTLITTADHDDRVSRPAPRTSFNSAANHTPATQGRQADFESNRNQSRPRRLANRHENYRRNRPTAGGPPRQRTRMKVPKWTIALTGHFSRVV